MKISTVLDHIDSGHIALPEFQRGYVWNRTQVRGLFESLYRKHPVGGLLVWVTESATASHRGDGVLAPGVVKLLLDGQQRMTSLYGVVRGKPPKFFDGNPKAFQDLRFHLDTEEFAFYQPVKMRDDPLWINVTQILKSGNEGHEKLIEDLASNEEIGTRAVRYSGRISRLLGILDIDLHTEEVTGADKTLETVVDIFNRVNSGGTKLSKGDLALAKICSDWPAGRDIMKNQLSEWQSAGYEFNLDWLLRSVNTVLTGEAQFKYLHDKTAAEVEEALGKAIGYINSSLNLIAGRLGLDHNQVLFGRFGIPVIASYLDLRKQNGLGQMNEKTRDLLMFWFAQAGMWGRFSGSTESFIDKDLEAVAEGGGSLEPLIEQLRLWNGGLRAEPGHFTGWSVGARFYPTLYLLTRMSEARDLGTGLPLKANMLGKMSKLEVHHIFPKAQLYKARPHSFSKSEVNALANFCFLTKDTNLQISDRLPQEYFPEIESAHPGALASQWVPLDETLWKVENYRDFLDARKILLAEALNTKMVELLHDDTHWLGEQRELESQGNKLGGITSKDEMETIESLNNWMDRRGRTKGIIGYDLADRNTGQQIAALDLAWPDGVQEKLSEPVVVLIDEEPQVVSLASQLGFRVFTQVEQFKQYVQTELS